MTAFAALAVPTRRHIIEIIAQQGRMTAGEISRRFSMTSSAISQHLKVLRTAGLLKVEKKAQQRIYEIDCETLHAIQNWAARMTERYDRLDILLQEQKNNHNPERKAL